MLDNKLKKPMTNQRSLQHRRIQKRRRNTPFIFCEIETEQERDGDAESERGENRLEFLRGIYISRVPRPRDNSFSPLSQNQEIYKHTTFITIKSNFQNIIFE